MKKLIACLTLLTMMSAIVSCGTTDSDSEADTVKPSLPGTTVSTETTGAAQENAATAAGSQTENNSGGNAGGGNTVGTTSASNNSTPASETITLNSADYLFGGYVSTQSDSLNMRSKPDTNSSIIVQIPSKTQLDIYKCDTQGWYLTSYDGKNGYVNADYIEQVPAHDGGDGLADKPNEYGYYTLTSNPNPGAGGPILSNLTGTFSDGKDTYTFYDCSAYDGKFTAKYADGTTVDGYAKMQYMLLADNSREYWYVLYDTSSKCVGCFRFTGDIPVNELNDGMRTFSRVE